MEEILASIRRIIADDQERVPPVRPTPVAVAQPPEPITLSRNDRTPDLRIAGMDLTRHDRSPVAEDLAADLEDETSPAAASPPAPAAPPPAPVAPTVAASEPPEAPALRGSGTLVSEETSASVGQAFGRLAATAQGQRGLTMEEHVTEMLRPMLKEWLDENLPALVERLVKDEIERVSRGR